MPTIVNMHEAKTHLSRLVERVLAGEEVVIARAGRPVAELRPVGRPDLAFGGLAGQISYDDEAFGEAADAEVAALFDGDPAGAAC
ncbi:type II toxin-antitoxin system Phd/YefM family antitoxin [Litorihabitans aurantiacus]|uniref:Antitoxin n=1 Tax=Litorihabitans aurantiacus TaxID=1930061 RepID=A0AA37XH78_9MICO|nr:type II toxin-antitoxin system prevent-host-death family antitoxin [Litorihabitans aurantiacus]GMA33036.1 hypothetical protein GCM10025875_30280 [Litorihabitans aurantiacus]